MEQNNNLRSAINMLTLLPKAKIHRVMLDENNPDKFMIGVSGTNKPFHLVENWGDVARQKEEVRFFSDNLSAQYPALKDTLEVVTSDSRVPNYSELCSLVTTTLETNGISVEESRNRSIYSDTLSVGYSQDGWDHDTTIPAQDFVQAYSVEPEVAFEANN